MAETAALLGYTGYVGSTLRKQRSFSDLYRSTNAHEIRDRSFDLVVCSAAPAQKWIANRDPQADLANINTLIGHLATIACQRFVLISTVDVFANPLGVSEQTAVSTAQLHAYGRHRRLLEEFVVAKFPHATIVRLAGLVGPGLRKNVVYDFLNDNNVHLIDSRGVFQFYPMVNLWSDIATAVSHDLPLVHFTAAPISVADIARHGFGFSFDQILTNPPATYDLRTDYAGLFGGQGGYQYNVRETLIAVRAYAQSEPKTVKVMG